MFPNPQNGSDSGQPPTPTRCRPHFNHADHVRARRRGHFHLPGIFAVSRSNPDHGRCSGSRWKHLQPGSRAVRKFAEQKFERFSTVRATFQSGINTIQVSLEGYVPNKIQTANTDASIYT